MPKDLDRATGASKSDAGAPHRDKARTGSPSSGGKNGGKRKKKPRTAGQVILLSLRNVLLALLLAMLLIGLICGGIVAGALFGYVETIDPVDIGNSGFMTMKTVSGWILTTYPLTCKTHLSP